MRLDGVTDQFTREAIEHAEKRVEAVIFQALQNTGESGLSISPFLG